MPTRPSTPYRWGTNAGARVAPSLARQGTGWAMNEPIDPLQCNDLWGQLSDWVDYLADVVPASNVFEAEVFRVVDPAGPTARGALTWTTIGGNAGLVVGGNAGGLPGIFFDNTTGYVKILQSTGPVVMLEVQPTGMVGPLAVAGADGGRFGYDSTDLLDLLHDFGPASGGYMPILTSAPALPPFFLVSGGSVKIYNPNAAPFDCALRRPVRCPYDPAMTGPGRFPKVVTLSATFTGAATDIGVRLIRIQRSTGVETIEGTITQAAPVYTFAGSGLVLDPEFRDYTIEVFSTGLAGTTGTTDTVRAIRLDALHALLLPVM